MKKYTNHRLRVIRLIRYSTKKFASKMEASVEEISKRWSLILTDLEILSLRIREWYELPESLFYICIDILKERERGKEGVKGIRTKSNALISTILQYYWSLYINIHKLKYCTSTTKVPNVTCVQITSVLRDNTKLVRKVINFSQNVFK